MEPVFGNHLGFVIDNQDPEGRHRIQVFIPYLSNTLFAGWNNELKDKVIKNCVSDLSDDIQKKLKQVLPWAEVSMPLFGGGTAMTANAATGKVSVNNGQSTLQPNVKITQSVETGTLKSGYGYSNTFGTPKTASSDGDPAQIAANSTPTSNANNEISQNIGNGGRIVTFNGGNSVSLNTDGPNNPVAGGVKATAANPNTGETYDSMSTMGVVVSDASLIGKKFTLDVTNTSTGQSKSLEVIGQDVNPSHGVGNGSGVLELTPKTADELKGLGLSYSSDYQSLNGTGQYTFAINPSDTSNSVSPEVLDENKTKGQIAHPEWDQWGANMARSSTPQAGGTGSPNGTFSIPNVGAKVWVFFYGGDIQKPVYFGSVVEPSAGTSFNKG